MNNQIPNIDQETGIHYGVISYNSIIGEALDDIYTYGRNLSYESCLEEARKEHVLYTDKNEPFDEDTFNDSYQSDEDTYLYERDGYVLQTYSLGLYVIKSPFVTMAYHCSPCCPNAGDLNNEGNLKTYCLGKDWFEDEKVPYTIENI